ncbi:MAG: hypothetical protein VZQ97_06985 [Candidatus Onthomonas sp.]|nr:hypothetical protein [Candidatus Onthomonas sp.]
MNQKSSSPLNSPEAAALFRDPTALRGLMQSQEARQLIALLQQQGDLNAAAKEAKKGNVSQLQNMLSAVSQSSQGGQVLSQLEQRLGK